MLTRLIMAVCLAVGAGNLPGTALSASSLALGVLDVQPYTVRAAGQPLSGLYVEILHAIVTRAGLDATIAPLPLARVLAGLGTGAIAGTLAIPNAKLLAEADAVAEVMSLQSVVIPQKNLTLSSLDDLHGRTVCQLLGSSFDQRLTDDGLITKVEVADTAQCLNMLRAGRVDAMAGPRVAMIWHAKIMDAPLDRFGPPLALNRASVHFLLSRKIHDEKLIGSIRDSVRRVKLDGTVDAIARRFGG